MALFDRRLEEIGEADLVSLVENEVAEGYQLEYKQGVAFSDKKDKLDFLAAVTSFANSTGGDLVIGIQAVSGVPAAVEGWDGIDVDAEKLRIEQLLRDAVEPRMVFRVHAIRLAKGKNVIVVRVPWSFAQPHMVKMDQVNRFYYRHSAGKAIMNVDQLRSAFAVSGGLPEQIEAYRRERVAAIRACEVLTSPAAPTVVFHIVPFESMRRGFVLNLEAALKPARSLLPLGCGSNGQRFNLDGIISVDDYHPTNAYTLLFRNGIVETASRYLLRGRTNEFYIPSTCVQRDVLDHLSRTLGTLSQLHVPPPAVALMSLLGVRELEFAADRRYTGHYHFRIDREDVLLPGTIIDDFDQDVIEIAHPIFDALWNAAGFARWFEYDDYRRRS
ncbi:MAG: helix-turn-helix domain-containing protein [Acidobacteriota bacterium]